VSFGGGEFGNTELGGTWRLCFCALPCDSDSSFAADAGELTIQGFAPRRSWGCTAGRYCELELRGTLLTADDRVRLAVGTCGISSKDPSIARDADLPVVVGANSSEPVTHPTMLVLEVADLPQGGQWKVCYCPDPSPSLVYTCDADAKFAALAGELTVYGPVAKPFFCLAGHECTLRVTGHGLTDLDQVSFGTACFVDRDQDTFLNSSWYVIGKSVRLPAAALPQGGEW
jgi:hypothetical protein